MNFKWIAAGAALAALAGGPASANLVINGSFESNGGSGQLGFNTSATGWSVATPPGSYQFLFTASSAVSNSVGGEYGSLALWGTGNGGLDTITPSPDGGYFVAMDGDFQTSALSQTINGLVAGHQYVLTYYWATSQQLGFNGDTQQSITASLGSQSFTTPVVTNPSHGFTGWYAATNTFTATSSSEVLSFLAYGSLPVPPFALIDGVSLNAVPEPSTWAMMALGFAGLGFAGYRASRRKAVAIA